MMKKILLLMTIIVMSTFIPKKVHAQSTVKEETSSQIGQYVTSILKTLKDIYGLALSKKGLQNMMEIH